MTELAEFAAALLDGRSRSRPNSSSPAPTGGAREVDITSGPGPTPEDSPLMSSPWRSGPTSPPPTRRSSDEPTGMARARDEVAEVLGGEARVDAVTVSANSDMMTRIADGTGTPLDDGSVAPTEALRQAIGVNDYVSRRHSPASRGPSS